MRPLLYQLAVVLSVLVTAVCGQCTAFDCPVPYPTTPRGTHALNHRMLLGNADDPGWYEANIPFLEVPDTEIQDVYYYRWQTYKEHLVYTGPIYGWLSSEFLQPVSYGAPYGGVVAAAGHHIDEGRWLRNQQYVKDDIDYWLNGPGRFVKPMLDGVNANASDWAHEYSFWAASAVWNWYCVTGDKIFTSAELPSLVHQYRGWDNHFNAALGLYWQVPVWDATEFTPASYESNDPYHGGAGYRPTINSYQYGDATAISKIASLAGDDGTSKEYANRAEALRKATRTYLWDKDRQFYCHMSRDNNSGHTLLDTREEEGFVPWMFDLPCASEEPALAELFDPQGFMATYGPTTAERRSRWFMKDATGCCHWDGPSWPYETSEALTGLANALDDYPSQQTVTAEGYLRLLDQYAATQYKNGKPYIAEAHDPDTAQWIYDAPGHSEDYNHSTFCDLVISGLIGIRAQPGNRAVIKPLAPSSWAYFALENLPYHGHNLSIFWDVSGTRYKMGRGLSVYLDGIKTATRPTIGRLTVAVAAPIMQSSAVGVVDAAANGQRFSYGPQPFASYTSPVDNPWNAIDGIVYRVGIPENSRWTSYATKNATDYFGVNFQRPVTLNDVRLYFYDDGGGVRTPVSFDLQCWDGANWRNLPDQTRLPTEPTPNGLNDIHFSPISTTQLRVVAPNAGNGVGWGLSEFAAFCKPIFRLQSVDSGAALSIHGPQATTDPKTASDWELQAADAGSFRICDVASHRCVTATPTGVGLQAPSRAHEQAWLFVDVGGGRFKIRNLKTGSLLATGSNGAVLEGVDNEATSTCNLWLPLVTGGSHALMGEDRDRTRNVAGRRRPRRSV